MSWARWVTMLAPCHWEAPARSAEAMAPEHADVPDASAICFSSGLATTEQARVSSPRLQSRTQARATSAADGGRGFACATAGTSSVARRTAIRFPERRTVRAG